MLPFLILILLATVAIATRLFWARISFDWLQKTAFLLAVSFPFERIPSLDTAVGPVRLAMILVAVSYYLIIILLLKRDQRLLNTKLTKEILLIFVFFLLSTLSFSNISNFTRFLVSYSGIFISFSTAGLISLFLGRYWWLSMRTILYLFVALIGFSAYQFLGDLAGLPGALTGMKDLFMSHVFGLPRIHATFNEPSYFANALFFGIFGFLFLSVSDLNILPRMKDKSTLLTPMVNFLHKHYRTTYFAILLILNLLFLATLAKSAWLILPVTMIPALIIFVRAKNFRLLYFPICLVIIMSLFFGFWFSYNNPQFINSVSDNIAETISGRSATAAERSSFLDAALEVLPSQIITGIGSGQFGTYARDVILFNTEGTNASQLIETEKLIVFNVYAEVWLEQGLGALLAFLALFALSIWKGIRRIMTAKDFFSAQNIASLSLVFYIISSMLQWNFISPLYINPIFVALGILTYINNHQLDPGENEL